jgi:hypothetical protein
MTTIPQTYDKKVSRILENSIDLTFVSEKGHGKTVACENLPKKIVENPRNRLIVFESFPKWINEFPVSFMEIPQNWIIQTDKTIDLENTWIRHEKSYRLLNEAMINQFLKENKHCVFLINSDDIEAIAYFAYSIVYKFYRRKYDMLRKGYPITENVFFLLEEAQNSLDRFVLTKGLFNRYRKLFSEARNMGLRWILITQRLQDLSTYFRCRTSLAIGKISLDDYDLKLNRMLKPLKVGKEILDMPIGSFYFSCINDMVQFPEWQKAKAKEWKPKQAKIEYAKIPETPKKKHSTLKAIAKGFYNLIFGIPRIKVGSPPYEKGYTCPNCGQSCSKEEFESGFCLDCDQIDFFDDFEGDP